MATVLQQLPAPTASVSEAVVLIQASLAPPIGGSVVQHALTLSWVIGSAPFPWKGHFLCLRLTAVARAYEGFVSVQFANKLVM